MANIKQACEILRNGWIVLHPTETCYGLACDATQARAVKRLYALKKMPRTKPVSIMVPTLKKAFELGDFPLLAKKLARKYWPGPLTMVVPRLCPTWASGKTVGIRIPAHKWTLRLLRAYGRPLVTTSANISGKKECYSIKAFLKQFPKNYQLKTKSLFIVDHGKIPRRKSSTVIKIPPRGGMKVLRRGNIRKLSFFKGF